MSLSARWRKSSRSGGDGGNCVELANVGLVRDSKHPTGPVLQADLTNLVNAIKDGQLDGQLDR